MAGTVGAAGRCRDRRGRVQRWLLAPSHRDIGTLYLLFAIAAGLTGGALSVAMRMELQEPGMQIFANARTFDVFVTAHGLIMVFFVVMPAMIGGFGNWMVPLMIGARDTAFPRLNAAAFWLIPLSFAALVVSLFVDAPLPVAGYAVPAGTLALAALLLAGLSYILSAINFITTIFNMRAPGVALQRMPLFVWSVLISAFLLLLSLPVLGGAITMLLAGKAFVPPGGEAGPAFTRQVFWFLGHPEVYILILPGFGIVHHVVSTFTGQTPTGNRGLAGAMAAIGVLGFAAWAQHLYGYGVAPAAGTQYYFLIAALVIAVPAGFKIAAWTMAIRSGGPVSRTPMLWAAGFIFLFAIGAAMGVIGVARGSLAGGGALKDTYFAVAQFHYMAALSAVFALFAGWYYWFPRMTGYACSEFLGRLHFWCTFIAVNVIFLPQHLLGMAGMPRHAADYANEFTAWNYISSLGTYLAAASLLVFLAAMAGAFVRRERAASDPWGAGPASREWAFSPASAG